MRLRAPRRVRSLLVLRVRARRRRACGGVLKPRVRVRGGALPRARRLGDAERQRVGAVAGGAARRRPARRSAGARRSRARARASSQGPGAACARQPVAPRRPPLRARQHRRRRRAAAAARWRRSRGRPTGSTAQATSFEFRQVVGKPQRRATWATSAGRRRGRGLPHAPAQRDPVPQRAVAACERGNILEWEQPLAERLQGDAARHPGADGAGVDSLHDAAAVRLDDRGGGGRRSPS